jgi:aryl-alcohol dehydrogenase-like predicted oxidoreductase
MATMEYREIPYVSKPVSRILYGAGGIGAMAQSDANRLLDEMVDLGVTTLDTARVYPGSEAAIGAWIKTRRSPDSAVLLSKCSHPTSNGEIRVDVRSIRADLDASRRILGTDHIDMYLLHRDDPGAEVGPLVETLNELHRDGAIGAFGGSNWSDARIRAANEYAAANGLIPFTLSSPNFGLADQVEDPWGGGCVTISGPENLAARQWYQESRMPVIAWSSLGRGFFSGRFRSDDPETAARILDAPARLGYDFPANFERLRRAELLAKSKNCSVAQIALAWVLCQSLETFAVVSVSSAARMQENIDAFGITLSPEEIGYLDLLTDS